MRVAIMTRLDTIDDIKIQKYLDVMEKVINDLKYKCVVGTLGKHREARYSHTHIHLICDVSGAKCYKELSQKINNMSIVREYRNNENIGKALAFNYDDGQQDKKGHYYDEDKILQYPLKEYADNTSMCQDLGQLITEILQKPEWEKYRNAAYQLWKSTRVAKQKTEKEERIGMYDYLDVEVLEKLIKKEDEYSDYERNDMLRMTMCSILDWYKQEDKNFSLGALKNQAVNYLFKSGVFNKYDVVGLAMIK